MEFVASHTAGRTLDGSPSMRTRRKLTKVSTIFMRLVVAFARMKALVRRAYEALPPSVDQCAFNSRAYFKESNVKGLWSKGTERDIVSSVPEEDCSESTLLAFAFFCSRPSSGGGDLAVGSDEARSRGLRQLLRYSIQLEASEQELRRIGSVWCLPRRRSALFPQLFLPLGPGRTMLCCEWAGLGHPSCAFWQG